MLPTEDESTTPTLVRDDLLTVSVIDLIKEDSSLVLLQSVANGATQDISELPELILSRIFTFPFLGDSVAGLALGLEQQGHRPIVDLGECALHLHHYVPFFAKCIEERTPLPLTFCTRASELNLPDEHRELLRIFRPATATALIDDLREAIMLTTPVILSLADLANKEESHAHC